MGSQYLFLHSNPLTRTCTPLLDFILLYSIMFLGAKAPLGIASVNKYVSK